MENRGILAGCLDRLRYEYALHHPFTIKVAFLPATLTAHPMTDQQFADFCSEHPDQFFEMSATGEIIVTPPKFSLTSIRNREIISQLDRWAAKDGRGVVGESSGGFLLPNGARRSPDASWIEKDASANCPREVLMDTGICVPPS